MSQTVILLDPDNWILEDLLQIVFEGGFSVGTGINHLFELFQFGINVEKVLREFEIFGFDFLPQVIQVGFEVRGLVEDFIEQNNILEFLDVLNFQDTVFYVVDVFFEVI